MKSCAEGSFTVAHEIGHIFGAAHNPANARNLAYPFGTGHLIQSKKKRKKGQGNNNSTGYRSIMAYNHGQNYPIRVNYFSSPDIILKESGTPTGTETSNNRRVLLMNRFAIAAIGDESSDTCVVAGGNGSSEEDEEDALAGQAAPGDEERRE